MMVLIYILFLFIILFFRVICQLVLNVDNKLLIESVLIMQILSNNIMIQIKMKCTKTRIDRFVSRKHFYFNLCLWFCINYYPDSYWYSTDEYSPFPTNNCARNVWKNLIHLGYQTSCIWLCSRHEWFSYTFLCCLFTRISPYRY